MNDFLKPPCTLGDMCAVCCGAYVDGVDNITGEIIKVWIQCECGMWSHVDCLENKLEGIICGVSLNLFNE